MLTLAELHRQASVCTACALCRQRTKAVPGEGPENARIMFIGEAPGFNEDQQGRPFVGAAGQFLEELLASVNLRRDQVYITNIVKCRPPNNREPLPGEVLACRSWLEQQIELLQPRIIVTLGRHSLAWFFPKESIGKLRGTSRVKDGRAFFFMYHPAAALHQQSLRQTIQEDFKKLPALLEQTQRPHATAEPSAQQLNLF